MKHLFWGVMALAVIATPDLAEAGTVTIPYGDWIQSSLPFMGWALTAVVAWVMRSLPASIAAILKTAQAEQILGKAIDFALNAVSGASKDRVLDAHVGNQVIAVALAYVVKYGPAGVIKFLGGEKGIRDRIIARLDLKPEVAVAAPHVLVQAPPAQ